jgi:hypothetical protein
MSKKKSEDVVLNHFPLTFKCDNGHEITVNHSVALKPEGFKAFQERSFHLECSQCDWEGDRLGSQATMPLQAEQSPETH